MGTGTCGSPSFYVHNFLMF